VLRVWSLVGKLRLVIVISLSVGILLRIELLGVDMLVPVNCISYQMSTVKVLVLASYYFVHYGCILCSAV